MSRAVQREIPKKKKKGEKENVERDFLLKLRTDFWCNIKALWILCGTKCATDDVIGREKKVKSTRNHC